IEREHESRARFRQIVCKLGPRTPRAQLFRRQRLARVDAQALGGEPLGGAEVGAAVPLIRGERPVLLGERAGELRATSSRRCRLELLQIGAGTQEGHAAANRKELKRLHLSYPPFQVPRWARRSVPKGGRNATCFPKQSLTLGPQECDTARWRSQSWRKRGGSLFSWRLKLLHYGNITPSRAPDRPASRPHPPVRPTDARPRQ